MAPLRPFTPLGCLLAAWFCLAWPLSSIPAENPQTDPVAQAAPPPAFKEVAPGIFQVGSLRLDKSRHTITFPAVVNLTESPVEYLLVTSYGKIHESVLRTETAPYQIHVAMLLLGARGAGTNAFPSDPSLPLPGESVSLTVRWNDDGRTNAQPAEALVLDRSQGQAMNPRRWAYNGSLLYEGTFLAQQEGSIVSLYTDPVALVNQSGPDRDNDENWLPNPKTLPPEETPVEVLLQLQKPPPKIPPTP